MTRLIPTTLLALASAALAQAPATFTLVPENHTCPIGFSATRQAIPQVTTASEFKKLFNSQGLHLTLNHLSEPAIESIEVTVYATTQMPVYVPAGQASANEHNVAHSPHTEDFNSSAADLSTPNGTPVLQQFVKPGSSPQTISRTFELHRTTGNSLREADVWMHEVGSVRYADLISITYADGTIWHSTPDLQCRAVPSNFVLVTKR